MIKLAHFSVKEYLVSEHLHEHYKDKLAYFGLSKQTAHLIISQSCLAYLLQFNTSKPLDKDLKKSSPLAQYAAKYWIFHAQSSGYDESESSSLFKLMTKLLASSNYAFSRWVQIYDMDATNMQWIDRSQFYDAQPLYYASMAGLEKMVELLVEKGENVNAQGGYYGNALVAAASKGHKTIVNLLIDKGADVNAHKKFALSAAEKGGHTETVTLLMERGADVNIQKDNTLHPPCFTQ